MAIGGDPVMQRIKFMIKVFLNEPLWFKLVITATFLLSVIFSSTFFSEQDYFQSLSKLAAAIFFGIYGIKLRHNRSTSLILLALAVVCVYLSIVKIV
jgi:amino acid permease